MRFGDKWCGWMKTLVFSSLTSVLINGSPTGDFKATRGLRQRDHLFHFLFLLVAEGFVDLLYKLIFLGEFEPSHLNDTTHIEFLQFADDTTLIGEC